MAEQYQNDETFSLKKQSANGSNQTSVGTMDGIVQTQATSKCANYDPKHPLKGMLTQLGFNTTGKIGWDLNYGGNANGVELRADGKYYYINKGQEGLGVYATALTGGQSTLFEISAFGGLLDFDNFKLKDTTREMTTYYDAKVLSILGFNQ